MADYNEQKLYEEKEKVLNQVFEELPELEKNKEELYKKILGNNLQQSKEDIILEEFSYNNTLYYKDSYDGILDNTATLVGTIEYENDKTVYNFFNTDYLKDSNKYNELIKNHK